MLVVNESWLNSRNLGIRLPLKSINERKERKERKTINSRKSKNGIPA
jgi:hypothetical protein